MSETVKTDSERERDARIAIGVALLLLALTAVGWVLDGEIPMSGLPLAGFLIFHGLANRPRTPLRYRRAFTAASYLALVGAVLLLVERILA